MAAYIDEDFEDWLCSKLKALNTDPDVFASYIRGILEGDETPEEKLEALQGILVEITAEDIPTVSMEIIHKWDNISSAAQENNPLKLDVDARLASIMEKHAQPVVNERKVSEEERKYREAILAQYSQISDEEDDAENCDYKGAPGPGAHSTDSPGIKNTNAEDVMKAEKEKRDKAKAECEKKKAADKANKEKQKQQQQERKEKEKKRTLKGERKR